MTVRLTNSEMRDFRRCRRKWYLGYYRGLQPARLDFNKPLSIGTRVHDVLAAYYQPGLARLIPMDYFRAGVEADCERHPEKKSDILDEADLCEKMLEGYFEWLAESGEDADLEVIASEVEMEAPLIDGVTLLSKIDSRVKKLSDGKVLALEHKTTQSLTDPVRRLQVDTQLLTEHLVEFLHDLGSADGDAERPRAEGALYNMLKKVKRTARAKPPFFGRETVTHNVEELRNHWRHVAAIAQEILDTRAALDAGGDPHHVCYPNPVKDCTWDCDFANVCLGGLFDDGSDPEPLLADNTEFVVGDPLERYRFSVGLLPDGTTRYAEAAASEADAEVESPR